MSSIDAGMNIAEVEDLARVLSASARTLEQHRAELERLVRKVAWTGAAGDRFRTVWWPQHRSVLSAGITEMQRIAATAKANVAEQRQASDDRGASSGSPTVAGAVAVAGGVTLRDILRLPKDEQAEAWARLTKQEQNALLAGKADSLGELDLVAPEIRYAANRQLMFEQWQQLTAKEASGLTASEAKRLELYTWLMQRKANVLFFDPSGDGRIAVVEGDLAHAKHVAVSVPGISTDMDTFGGMVLNSERLQKAAPDSAVVSWLGYDAPVGVGVRYNPALGLVLPLLGVAPSVAQMAGEIPNKVLADAGADALVGFVKGIRDTNPGADVTVIGHSYGSLVTGLAAQRGLDANNVVFLGSPGVGAGSVHDFNLPEGAQVYAAAPGGGIHVGGVQFGGDAVANIGTNVHPFGGAPTDPSFGAHVLDIGDRVNPIGSHSDYFKQDSTSLQRIASVVNGNGGAL